MATRVLGPAAGPSCFLARVGVMESVLGVGVAQKVVSLFSAARRHSIPLPGEEEGDGEEVARTCSNPRIDNEPNSARRVMISFARAWSKALLLDFTNACSYHLQQARYDTITELKNFSGFVNPLASA